MAVQGVDDVTQRLGPAVAQCFQPAVGREQAGRAATRQPDGLRYGFLQNSGSNPMPAKWRSLVKAWRSPSRCMTAKER